jgi:acyl transferase domain-containing protein
MGCLLPGARNVGEFWQNVLQQKDSITDIPATHWNVDDYYDPDPLVPDKSYCKRGGFLPSITFDPMAYGIAPKDLDVLDSAQLLGMVIARDALEDAGYLSEKDGRSFDRDRCSVILGTTSITELSTPLNMRLAYPTISKVLDAHGLNPKTRDSILSQYRSSFPVWQENSFPGVLGNVVSGRIASHLNLGGTNCVIDAACASALGALKMATDALISGSCDMAISGGVDTINNVFMYMCFSKTPAFSMEGMSRPFDEKSDGILIAEGVALTVLKRLDDAIRDGDRIYSVIEAVGSSSDGKSRSVYQPLSPGQSKAIRQAHDMAGIQPDDVELLEAHGTGTRVGDATELEGLHAVFGRPGEKQAWCALGSVKSQIGHAKACAGMAGLLKGVLSTYHKVLPGTINIDKPNPKLELEDSAFYLNTEPRPWISRRDIPRKAGVSAFGFGGTNFHVILSEYNADEYPAVASTTTEFFPFSAETPKELATLLKETLEILPRVRDLSSFARFVQHRVDSSLLTRACLVANSIEELTRRFKALSEHLQTSPEATFSTSKGTYYLPGKEFEEAKVGLVFPGQGSQYLGMMRSLYLTSPKVQKLLNEMDELRKERGLEMITELIWPVREFLDSRKSEIQERLKRTDHAQASAAFAHLATSTYLKEAGLKPDAVAGHSFGELSALHFSGAVDYSTYLDLAWERGRVMEEASRSGDGSMLAVIGDIKKVKEVFQNFLSGKNSNLVMANENSPNQVVLSGLKSELQSIQEVLEEEGLRTKSIPVGAAFHSPLMEGAASHWKSYLADLKIQSPALPVYSCSDGNPYPQEAQRILDTLGSQLRNPVLFQQQIESMYSDGIRIFVEAGPGRVCCHLISEILGDRPHVVLESDGGVQGNEISTWSSLSYLSHSLAQLFAMGKLDLQPAALGEEIVEFPEKQKVSPASIQLNGANYLRPETKEAPYGEAEHPIEKLDSTNGLKDLQNQPVGVTSSPPRHKVPEPVKGAVPTARNRTKPVGLERQGDVAHRATSGNQTNTGVKMSQNDQAFREMGEFHRYRMKMLEVHEQFLQTQTEANRLYEKMLFGDNLQETPVPLRDSQPAYTLQAPPAMPQPQPVAPVAPTEAPVQQVAPVLNRVSEDRAPESIPIAPERPVSIAPSSAQPSPLEAVSAHKVHNGSLLSSMFQKKPTEENSVQDSQSADANLEDTVLGILAEKTGFPKEMLNLEMDLESDLAVDSIRRVEILGAVQEAFPSSPKIGPSDMGVLKTIADMCSHLRASETANPEIASEEIPTVEKAEETGSTFGHTEILKELLKVISEKTGFPMEMLNPDMCLEDDLAVDSIRRVEILGAIREKFPSAPKIDPTQMGVLKTISDLVGHLSESMDDFLGSDPKKKSQMA